MAVVVLATRSAGKLREIRALTATAATTATASAAAAAARGEIHPPFPLTWRGLADFPEIPEADEPGRTFSENARHKALFYAQRTGLPTLADDSGLEVDALGGAPGVDSACFAGHPRDDAANNRRLVEALRDVPPERRTARFRCVLVLARPGVVLGESTGTVAGVILLTPRGAGGFGYDPHFLLPELGRTFAELSSDEKNAHSHRGQALRALLQRLPDLLAQP